VLEKAYDLVSILCALQGVLLSLIFFIKRNNHPASRVLGAYNLESSHRDHQQKAGEEFLRICKYLPCGGSKNVIGRCQAFAPEPVRAGAESRL
jgi:hypothetical protein